MKRASFFNHPLPTNKDEYVILLIEVKVFSRQLGTFIRLEVEHINNGHEIYVEDKEHGSIGEAYAYVANLLYTFRDWKHQTQTTE